MTTCRPTSNFTVPPRFQPLFKLHGSSNWLADSGERKHINNVIENAWRQHGLGTYLMDPLGRDVLIDPKMMRASVRPKRDIEDIKLIGELRRPLSTVFADDPFAHGELMRFFQ